MLLALNNHNELILASNAQITNKYFCPDCHAQLRLRAGPKIMIHFAHFKHSDCKSMCEGESTIHIQGKQQLMDFFKPHFKELQLEYYLKSIHQRPDLMLNQRHVIEYQCSPIKTKRLNERLTGYARLNITSHWILGPKFYHKRINSKLMQQFILYRQSLGFYLLFWLNQPIGLILRYQIRMINGRINYLERHFLNYFDYYRFFTQLQLKASPIVNLNWQTEMKRIQKKLSYRQTSTLRVQEQCYLNHHNLFECPIICYYPIIEMPYYFNQIIELRVLIIIILERYSIIDYKTLLQQIDKEFAVCINFSMLNFNLAETIINNFLHLLTQKRYIQIKKSQIKVKQKFNWRNKVL